MALGLISNIRLFSTGFCTHARELRFLIINSVGCEFIDDTPHLKIDTK